MIKHNSQDILLNLQRTLLEGRTKESAQILASILQNQQGVANYLRNVNMDLVYKNLSVQEEKYSKQGEHGEIAKRWVLFTKLLFKYYRDRESGSEQIIDSYIELFKNCEQFLEQRVELFSFVVKSITKEYNLIIKQMKANAKDAEAVKRATQASKKLDNDQIQTLTSFLRIVTQKNYTDLKVMLSNQQMKIQFSNFKFDQADKYDKLKKETSLVDVTPKEDLITYNYYKGRILMFESNFFESSQHLQNVFNNCPNTKKGKKVGRQVLKYLIPVNIFMGRYPTLELLKQYNLLEYKDICETVRQGDIKSLNIAIDKYRMLWISRSLIVLMDQIKVFCYRNLCKKVWLINKKERKINLNQFFKAFQISHSEANQPTIPEVCCIIGNLIYLDLIAGRIFQGKDNNRWLTMEANPFTKKKPEDINWQI
ncbi:hypothetical protein pb186bvf_012535 [Paramecium bursaria]